jgi:hypothetical protein
MDKKMAGVYALTATVAEMGKQGAPSGICYAAMMAHGWDLQEYTDVVQRLQGAKLLRQANHVLYYTGPALTVSKECAK